MEFKPANRFPQESTIPTKLLKNMLRYQQTDTNINHHKRFDSLPEKHIFHLTMTMMPTSTDMEKLPHRNNLIKKAQLQN